MAVITINGIKFSSTNGSISVKNNSVYIDGRKVDADIGNTVELRIVEGVINNLSSDISVSCRDVGGNVKAKGSVSCDSVGGNVTSKGSVSCDDVGGDVIAGGSVSCDDVGGLVKKK